MFTSQTGERAAQERVMYAAQLVESVDVKERKLVLGRKGKEENRKWMEGSKAGCWDWWVGLASLLTSMLPSTLSYRPYMCLQDVYYPNNFCHLPFSILCFLIQRLR